jgi:protein KRI1
MAKRKADSIDQPPLENGTKKVKHSAAIKENKPNLLDDSDSASSEDDSEGGAELEQPEFRINEEFAKKFEHNKKREELHRC